MSHLYERIINNEISYQNELLKIRKMFEKEDVNTNAYYDSISIANYIDDGLFRNLDLSCNYLSLFDLINNIILNPDNASAFIEYCELIISLTLQIDLNDIRDGNVLGQKFKEIIKIIIYDLNVLNLEIKFEKNEKLGKIAIVIPKDELLEDAIEDIDDKTVVKELIEYKSNKTKGNISRKEELIYRFGKFIEPVLKNKNLYQLNERLFKNVSFMLNNFDLRHNNVETNETKYYTATIKEREKWLDRLYTEILLVMRSERESEINSEIEKLKKQV